MRNKIVFNEVKDAVKVWACGLDGFDGALGGIYETIPWDEEMEEVYHWDNAAVKFDNLIPTCPHFDAAKIITADVAEYRKLNEFSNKVAEDICNTYALIIGEITTKKQKWGVVKVMSGVVNGVCQYKDFKYFYADTWMGVIRQVIADCNPLKDEFAWTDMDELVDACFFAIHKKGSVHLGGDRYLYFKDGESSCKAM